MADSDVKARPNRAAILRRRALLMTSALGALGCGGPKAPGTGSAGASSSAAVITLPSASGETPIEPVPGSAVPSPPPKPVGVLPPLDIPGDVSAGARPAFERLAQQVPPIHAALDALPVPKNCPIDKNACDAAWRALAKALVELDDEVSHLTPRCPGTSPDAKRFDARLAAHLAYIAERRQALVHAVAELQRWKDMYDEAERNFPRPCLKYACKDW